MAPYFDVEEPTSEYEYVLDPRPTFCLFDRNQFLLIFPYLRQDVGPYSSGDPLSATAYRR